MNLIIDRFTGDPKGCYAAISAAVGEFDIPDVSFDWSTEERAEVVTQGSGMPVAGLKNPLTRC